MTEYRTRRFQSGADTPSAVGQPHREPRPGVEASQSTTLFCIPHAGGSAAYYAKFVEYFSESVTVEPLEIAGRGRRSRELLSNNMETICNDLFTRIVPIAKTRPYALFGHSMGGLLAFLCTVLTLEHDLPLPQALFISACATPDSIRTPHSPPISSLPPERLWKHLAELGGMPKCVTDSKELCKYLEPIIYADFKALDTWTPTSHSPVPVPITVFMGKDDKLPEEKAREWAQLTTAEFSLRSFAGNHFYLQDQWEGLAENITQTLYPEG